MTPSLLLAVALGLYKKESSQRNGRPVYKQLLQHTINYSYSEYYLYYDGEYWVLETKENEEFVVVNEDPPLWSKSDKDIFPPTNWTVWVWKGSWLPDNQLRIVTGAEVTNYKPCQRVTISFDGTPPKIIEDAFGDYLPTNEYIRGRTLFRHQDNQNVTLHVDAHYNNWLVAEEDEVEGSSEVQSLLHSLAAGDMNPASDRNSQCISRCFKGGLKLKPNSWFYRESEDDWNESDKIKVSCSSTKEDESSDGNDESKSKIESSKNIESSETEERSTGKEESGNWTNVEVSESENRINIEDPPKKVSSIGQKESSDGADVNESETEGSGITIEGSVTESSTGNKDY